MGPLYRSAGRLVSPAPEGANDNWSSAGAPVLMEAARLRKSALQAAPEDRQELLELAEVFEDLAGELDFRPGPGLDDRWWWDSNPP